MVFSGYSDFLHDITEIPVLLKVALSTITLNLLYLSKVPDVLPECHHLLLQAINYNKLSTHQRFEELMRR
jgi:hypothetical protein